LTKLSVEPRIGTPENFPHFSRVSGRNGAARQAANVKAE